MSYLHNRSQSYLSFQMHSETFAIPTKVVVEIVESNSILKVPQTPHFMSGIIYFRGKIVPVIDIAEKLNLGQIERKINTAIIIIEKQINEHVELIGFLIDKATGVQEIKETELEKVPAHGGEMDVKLFKGIKKIKDQFVFVLDNEKIFSFENLMQGENLK